MSPCRPSHQRRRSLSVSPSIYHDHLCIDSCHPPAKRTHSRKDLPRQWDLDSWRREKRPRTQHTSVRSHPLLPPSILDRATLVHYFLTLFASQILIL